MGAEPQARMPKPGSETEQDPWRADMDRALNQFVSGSVNGRGFDFKYGREVEKALQRSLGLGR